MPRAVRVLIKFPLVICFPVRRAFCVGADTRRAGLPGTRMHACLMNDMIEWVVALALAKARWPRTIDGTGRAGVGLH